MLSRGGGGSLVSLWLGRGFRDSVDAGKWCFCLEMVERMVEVALLGSRKEFG